MKYFLKKVTARIILTVMVISVLFIAGTSGTFAATGPNLISNPSVEQSNATIFNVLSAKPTGWNTRHDSKNVSYFYYPTLGYNSSKSITVQIFLYKQTREGWYFNNVNVSPGKTYNYSDTYKSSGTSYLAAEYKLADGTTVVTELGSFPASYTVWKTASAVLTPPANAVSVTVLHYLKYVGYLTTDNYSLTENIGSTPVTPSVSITSPAGGEKWQVGTTHNVTWTSQGVSKVNVYINRMKGNIITNGSFAVNVTAAQGSFSWAIPSTFDFASYDKDKFYITIVGDGTVRAQSNYFGIITGSSTPDTTKPAITLIGSAKVSVIVGNSYTDAGATATDNIDGNITSKIVTVNPVDTTKVGVYTVTYNVSDLAGNKATQVTREVNVITPAISPPSVSITDPAPGTILSHAILIKSNPQVISPNTISRVQFYVDNSAFGSPVTTSPFQIVLDTAQFPDGSHTLGAITTDSLGISSAKTTVSVSFSNTQTINPNLISNSSLEAGTTSPTDWLNSGWGTNNATFTYPVAGHTGNDGAGITITAYTDGDAKWYFKNVNVSPATQYVFSDFYKSTANTSIVAMFTLSNGTVSYGPIGAATPATGWTQFSTTLVTPNNAVSMTVFHLIQSVGTLSVDDFSLSLANSMPFAQGMVSLNFDDGVPSFFANGLPILTSHNIKSTDYILSGELGNASSITTAQMLQLQSLGHEIGDHTKTHADLTTLTQPQIVDEVANSKIDLQNLGVNYIQTFSYPYGTWNNLADQIVKQSGYIGARTALVADGGPNFRDGNPFLIRTYSVEATTTLADVKGWIDQAVQNKTWIVLVLHGVDTLGGQYSTTPAMLTSIADYITSKNVKTVTNAEGVYMMTHR